MGGRAGGPVGWASAQGGRACGEVGRVAGAVASTSGRVARIALAVNETSRALHVCAHRPLGGAVRARSWLKQLAAAHGRRAEAEHREILRAALCQPSRRSFKEVLASMPDVGVDEDFNFRQG